eukprot:CAMPEP_0203923000 /NCGR_PEP_ID=MMETSP0359-20131031/62960_1 /ASSEMBLY_ACC=CAM_ASM_000338 /TAXON_ID=268821 /ORGANISM="Scrippsiella Hangoei, Strain SHTV-5" /LENGTH=83 /DNA_ID=CAMNT_0050851001 /DNA_START=218 /DNA_END=469 /DNA_ORIENTATION=+
MTLEHREAIPLVHAPHRSHAPVPVGPRLVLKCASAERDAAGGVARRHSDCHLSTAGGRRSNVKTFIGCLGESSPGLGGSSARA